MAPAVKTVGVAAVWGDRPHRLAWAYCGGSYGVVSETAQASLRQWYDVTIPRLPPLEASGVK